MTYTYIYATEIHHICGWSHHCLQGLLHSTCLAKSNSLLDTEMSTTQTKTMDWETKTDILLQPLKPDKTLKIS